MSGSYARVHQPPIDPVVAGIAPSDRWEASLSGAAAGLALRAVQEGGGLEAWEVREAAWQAGYLHEVHTVRGWSVPPKAPAPDGIAAFVTGTLPGDDLGLVRARGTDGDAWVGLRGRPVAELGVMPRVTPTGDTLELPPLTGTWVAADPDGHLTTGDLGPDARVLLTLPGEWLVQLDLADQSVVFPVYVGDPAPTEPLLRRVDGPPDTAMRTLLDEVRDAYALEPWAASVLLDQAAAAVLTNGSDPVVAAQDAGVLSRRLLAWTCRAPSVPACVDSWVWDPRRRADLWVDGRVGLATRVHDGAIEAALLVVPATLPAP